PGPGLAAKAATRTIPIVFAHGADPVELGLVASLNRPGGNVTGYTNISQLLNTKRLELLCELVPSAGVIGVLLGPRNATNEAIARDLEAAGRALGRRAVAIYVTSAGDLDAAFATALQQRAGALLVDAQPVFINQRDQV